MATAAPITEAQLNANRQNATHSTGPRTENGKNRARLNGLRHGLTGQTVVMPHEDRAAYQRFCAETIASLRPETDAERALAQAIANDHWRLNRARAIEENIFSLGLASEPVELEAHHEVRAALTQAQTFLNHARELQLLTLYAQRIARAIEKSTAELRALQAARRNAREQALEEAQLLARLALSKGQVYDPANDFPPANGFGFSASEIDLLIDRRNRLHEARQMFKTLRKAA